MSVAIRRKSLGRARARVARLSNARLILTFVALLAFTCQSYLTQTHIHFATALTQTSGIDTKAPAAAPTNAPQDKYPASQDPANCPICQESALAGHYIAPMTASLLLPSVIATSVIIFLEVAIPSNAASHNWQGRAPPV